MLKPFLSAVMSGILLAIGGCVYLSSLTSAQLYVDAAAGALLLSAAFILIALKGYALFTESAAGLAIPGEADRGKSLLAVLLGNLLGSAAVGSLIALTMGEGLSLVAYYSVLNGLAEPWYATLVRAILCGILLSLAFSVYREKESLLGVLFAAPAFIMADLEHGILNMFYFSASGYYGGLRAVGLVLLVLLGNAAGAMLFPLLSRLMTYTPPVAEEEEELPYESIFSEEDEEEDENTAVEVEE